MSKKQTTLADLAHELNLSTATVSRALKDYPDISAATKKRVIALAKAWNYRPNSLAAGLRKQETRIIGVIVPEIANHFFSEVIKGIMQAASKAGYRVMICQSDERYVTEKENVEVLLSSRVDGLMVSVAHGTLDFDHFAQVRNEGVPLVFFDKIPPGFLDCSRVIVDDFEGAYGAVSHLISQGRKRIAHLGGPGSSWTGKQRLAGYEAALKAHGREIDADLIAICPNFHREEGAAATTQLMQMESPPDAIFSVTDYVAIGALTSLRALGVAIPEEVALAGFCDWEMTELMAPPLTSVFQPGLEMGRRATEILLNEMRANRDDKTVDPQHLTLPTELRVRASSKLETIQPQSVNP